MFRILCHFMPQRLRRHLPHAFFDNKKSELILTRYIVKKMVVEDGFEPSKSVTADLQSAPFGRSGIPPHIGAGRGSRTPMTSLEGWCTAVMPYPHNFIFLSTATVAFLFSIGFSKPSLAYRKIGTDGGT